MYLQNQRLLNRHCILLQHTRKIILRWNHEALAILNQSPAMLFLINHFSKIQISNAINKKNYTMQKIKHLNGCFQ